jgi:hypothetical protein
MPCQWQGDYHASIDADRYMLTMMCCSAQRQTATAHRADGILLINMQQRLFAARMTRQNDVLPQHITAAIVSVAA